MVTDPSAPTRWTRALVTECVAVAFFAVVACLVAAHGRSTYYNNYVRFADALLHGHFWIDWPDRTIDAAAYHGRHYMVDAPFPTLFVFPLVLLYGVDANQTNVAIMMGTLATVLGWYLAVRLGVERRARLFLALFLFAGTDIFWCSELGDVWFLAHLVAVAFTFLALLELLGRRRSWLVALLAVCATESRFTLVMALPVYAYVLASGGWFAPQRLDWRPLRGFAAVVGLGVVFWIAYNEALWGLPFDIGHTLYFHQDPWGLKSGSPFGLRYLPYQIYSYFMRAPILVDGDGTIGYHAAVWPILKADPEGVALTFTSPALVLAFFSRAPRRIVAAMTVAAALVAGPNFLYYLNGWYQFGMRHALDFLPFLFVLMAYAARDGMPRWGRILCVYSAIAGAWGVWYWGIAFRTGLN